MTYSRLNRGFTLIELLVVIAIISLLSSIVLSSLNSARTEGNDTSKIEALQQTSKALELYIATNGYYPQGSGNATLVSALVPKYIESINSGVLYQSTTVANAGTCASNCPSYLIAIPLSLESNLVLSSDKNINLGSIDGAVDNCVSGIASTPYNLCYELTL